MPFQAGLGLQAKLSIYAAENIEWFRMQPIYTLGIVDLTGIRLRQIPFTPERVMAALKQVSD